MKVHFKRGWFGPDLNRYRKSVNKHDYRDVPEALRALLPSTATIIDNPEAAPVAPKESLKDHDIERAAGDAAQAKVSEADEFVEAMKRKGSARK